MKPKHLFIADGAGSVLLGIVFVVLPGLALSVLGIAPHDQARQLLTALLGASLITIGGFELLMRNDAESAAGIAFMRASIAFDVIGAVLSFVGLVAGIFNVFGWLFVLVFVVLAALHVFWGLMRPAGRRR